MSDPKWRNDGPSWKQKDLLKKMGLEVPATKGEASDLISKGLRDQSSGLGTAGHDVVYRRDIFGGEYTKVGSIEEFHGPNGEYWNSDMDDE